jgi:hypothetical protein
MKKLLIIFVFVFTAGIVSGQYYVDGNKSLNQFSPTDTLSDTDTVTYTFVSDYNYKYLYRFELELDTVAVSDSAGGTTITAYLYGGLSTSKYYAVDTISIDSATYEGSAVHYNYDVDLSTGVIWNYWKLVIYQTNDDSATKVKAIRFKTVKKEG